MSSKFELRRHLRQRRRALSLRQRHQASQALCKRLGQSALFRRSHRIAAYWPVDGEMDVTPLIEQALRQGKRVYLPCLAGFGPGRLWFRRYRGCKEPMSPNRFGIDEPTRGERISAKQLDLVLAPLLAFDRQGNRLGMGGGFYDRTFAFLGKRRAWRQPRIVGTAYAFQEVPELPAEPWDVGLWGCATEAGLRRFRRG
ncbi:5-formyltetrahydrofolate cyclo-ligase [Alkalilimnicola ehrlichii]|uniref:5-formyltetrahydrofolate cyclo-ligase n=1 Tax=Alkalilimnicola ehrlichii TaxID=351052 RepID=A0A3E0X3Q4_9GAMM|nr:5-formyltetrahydrofolate cyclo-ligase [Alkalilimnicola ehrlichii]RFA31253.1 5-formyltetrahydrofolate cyclo-ligase [Alkalilimnicola ehrlichii]RFA39470.1 5-formyltetrahydrofolate cyclo-ligase [Alkalilimnicola ehrlichii]